MPAAEITRRAYEASNPENSIVTSSVMSAVAGEFGNFHHPATKSRTASSKLYISALMRYVSICCVPKHQFANHCLAQSILGIPTSNRREPREVFEKAP
jgi:hypothetical protein